MAKSFSVLRERMTPEAQKEARDKTRRMLEEYRELLHIDENDGL